MKNSKDPFEAALEEQEESPPESPVGGIDEGQTSASQPVEEDEIAAGIPRPPTKSKPVVEDMGKNKEEDDEEEEENMEVELAKYPSSADPAKMAKMQAILSQFTEDQMSRYESFRRSALQKSNMRRLGSLWESGKTQDQSGLATSEKLIEDLNLKEKYQRDLYQGSSDR